MINTEDLGQIVAYCLNRGKNSTVLYGLSTDLWADLSQELLKKLYNILEKKRIELGVVGK